MFYMYTCMCVRETTFSFGLVSFCFDSIALFRRFLRAKIREFRAWIQQQQQQPKRERILMLTLVLHAYWSAHSSFAMCVYFIPYFFLSMTHKNWVDKEWMCSTVVTTVWNTVPQQKKRETYNKILFICLMAQFAIWILIFVCALPLLLRSFSYIWGMSYIYLRCRMIWASVSFFLFWLFFRFSFRRIKLLFFWFVFCDACSAFKIDMLSRRRMFTTFIWCMRLRCGDFGFSCSLKNFLVHTRARMVFEHFCFGSSSSLCLLILIWAFQIIIFQLCLCCGLSKSSSRERDNTDSINYIATVAKMTVSKLRIVYVTVFAWYFWSHLRSSVSFDCSHCSFVVLFANA